jgi:hypothetical protein
LKSIAHNKKAGIIPGFLFFWLPRWNDFRTTHAIISIGYDRIAKKKSVVKKKAVNLPKKHVIHKAKNWQKMLDERKVCSLNEIRKYSERRLRNCGSDFFLDRFS